MKTKTCVLIAGFYLFAIVLWANHFIPVYQGYGYNNMTFFIDSATINGINMESGDEIGIFDGELCVGAGILTSEIPPIFQMVASADDPTTGELDGFISGNPIIYRLWDSSDNLEITDVVASYTLGDGTFTQLGTAMVGLEGSITATLIADFEAVPLTGYAPLEVQFTDISTCNPTIWEWDFDNDGTIDSYEQNPIYTYSDSGIYTVSLTASDGTNSDTETKVDYIIVYTPEPPASPSDLIIEIIGNDAILSWTAVNTTIYGNPISVDYYLVFHSEWAYPDSTFFFHGYTADTTYTHYAVGQFSDIMFYKVVSYIGSIERLNAFLEKKKTFIIQDMKNIGK